VAGQLVSSSRYQPQLRITNQPTNQQHPSIRAAARKDSGSNLQTDSYPRNTADISSLRT
jgi:hypothetical protein